jgi:hypothetical protein
MTKLAGVTRQYALSAANLCHESASAFARYNPGRESCCRPDLANRLRRASGRELPFIPFGERQKARLDERVRFFRKRSHQHYAVFNKSRHSSHPRLRSHHTFIPSSVASQHHSAARNKLSTSRLAADATASREHPDWTVPSHDRGKLVPRYSACMATNPQSKLSLTLVASQQHPITAPSNRS